MRAVVQGICAYDVINYIWLNPFPLETGSIEKGSRCFLMLAKHEAVVNLFRIFFIQDGRSLLLLPKAPGSNGALAGQRGTI